MAQAKRDENRIPTLLGVSSADGVTPVVLWADPTTHRLLVDLPGGGGSGTVTSVSVTTANGVSGSVATATTTPAITLTLGAITPSTVNGLTFVASAVGFTIAGGTTSKTLTVPLDATVSGTNTGDQTSVSGNAGTATALATARAIYGNNFDGTAALTQIIASTYGGTGNGFTKFTGPTTAERTFTLPDASSTIIVSGGALGTPSSGTLTNCTFPTLNQNTTGYASGLKSATTTVDVASATAPSVGQVLTATSSTAATWQTAGAGSSEWTYVSKVTYAAESGAKSFTSLSTRSNYKLVVRIYNTSATDISTYVTLNNIATGYVIYKTDYAGTGALQSGLTKYKFVEYGAALAGQVSGELIIDGKHRQGYKGMYSVGPSAGNYTRSDTLVAFSGALSGDSNDVSRVDVSVTGVCSGTVELWYKDAQ